MGLEGTYLEGLLDFEVVWGQARGDFVNSLEETYKVTWLLLGTFYLQIISSKLNNCLQNTAGSQLSGSQYPCNILGFIEK